MCVGDGCEGWGVGVRKNWSGRDRRQKGEKGVESRRVYMCEGNVCVCVCVCVWLLRSGKWEW